MHPHALVRIVQVLPQLHDPLALAVIALRHGRPRRRGQVEDADEVVADGRPGQRVEERVVRHRHLGGRGVQVGREMGGGDGRERVSVARVPDLADDIEAGCDGGEGVDGGEDGEGDLGAVGAEGEDERLGSGAGVVFWGVGVVEGYRCQGSGSGQGVQVWSSEYGCR